MCTECDTSKRYTLADPDTCQYLVCPDGTFYDSNYVVCMECDSSCETCYGDASDNCLSCSSTTFLSDYNTCQTCNEVNSGLKFSSIAEDCIEICGKGFNLGSLECDDGNTIDGDG